MGLTMDYLIHLTMLIYWRVQKTPFLQKCQLPELPGQPPGLGKGQAAVEQGVAERDQGPAVIRLACQTIGDLYMIT